MKNIKNAKNYMEYNGYIGTVSYSQEDKVLVGAVYGIDDLITYEGDTVEEIETAFNEAVDDYLELCKACQREPDKIYKGQFNVRIGPDIHKRLAMQAIREGVSLNQLIEQILSQHLAHRESSFDVSKQRSIG